MVESWAAALSKDAAPTASARMIALEPAVLWTPDDIERAFPAAPEPPKPNGGGSAPISSGTADEASIPADTMKVIRNVPSKGNAKDRSLAFFNVVMVLKELGFTVDGIFELLER